MLAWLQQQHPTLQEHELRARLTTLGIKQGVPTQPLTSLSGGQAVRVALCNALIKAPQLLVLDEVTNHLDMATVAGLAEALREYRGGLVLVSHDQWFVQQVGGRVGGWYWWSDGLGDWCGGCLYVWRCLCQGAYMLVGHTIPHTLPHTMAHTIPHSASTWYVPHRWPSVYTWYRMHRCSCCRGVLKSM